MRRKEERSKQGQTNNKAEQHSTPKAVTFPKKNKLPRVGLEPTTLYTLDRALALPLSYQGSSAGWAQISHALTHTHKLTLYPKISRCPSSCGGSHSTRMLVWLMIVSSTPRGALGVPAQPHTEPLLTHVLQHT